jgi:hypothetical protein
MFQSSNSKPEEQNPKWVMAGASKQIMFQSSNSKPEEQNPKWVMAGASRQIMFQSSHQSQRSHQSQEAYQKEGASHQNKPCFKTPTNHKKHIKKGKGWKE